jgi:hypothetical protein
MRTEPIKVAVAALALALLAACDRAAVREDTEPVVIDEPERAAEPAPARISEAPAERPRPPRRDTVDLKGPAPVVRILPETTGVKACDDYLSSYVACHLTLGALEPTTVEDRYQKLRLSLLEDSLDPTAADALAQRCSTLTDTMKDALAGRDCDEIPVEPVAEQPQ